MIRWNRVLAVMMLALLGVMMIVGCTPEQMEEIKDVIGMTQDQIPPVQASLNQAEADRAKLEVDLLLLPAGPKRDKAVETIQRLDEVISASQEWLELANKSLLSLQARLASAENSVDVVEAALQTGLEAARPFIPPPWGLVIGTTGGMALAIWRAIQNRNTAKNIARSVGPAVEEKLKASPEEATRISSIQGTAGKRLVDEVQGKKFSLPF